jgi:hypothetical protein
MRSESPEQTSARYLVLTSDRASRECHLRFGSERDRIYNSVKVLLV